MERWRIPLSFKKVFVGNNCVIKNSIILNDVYLGDNTYIENCIVESRDTIRANTRHVGENGVKVVVEKERTVRIVKDLQGPQDVRKRET